MHVGEGLHPTSLSGCPNAHPRDYVCRVYGSGCHKAGWQKRRQKDPTYKKGGVSSSPRCVRALGEVNLLLTSRIHICALFPQFLENHARERIILVKSEFRSRFQVACWGVVSSFFLACPILWAFYTLSPLSHLLVTNRLSNINRQVQ
jgi:hypothetical protein